MQYLQSFTLVKLLKYLFLPLFLSSLSSLSQNTNFGTILFKYHNGIAVGYKSGGRNYLAFYNHSDNSSRLESGYIHVRDIKIFDSPNSLIYSVSHIIEPSDSSIDEIYISNPVSNPKNIRKYVFSGGGINKPSITEKMNNEFTYPMNYFGIPNYDNNRISFGTSIVSGFLTDYQFIPNDPYSRVGTDLVISGFKENIDGVNNSGAFYHRFNGSFRNIQKFNKYGQEPIDRNETGDQFGYSLALVKKFKKYTNYLAVGAPGEDISNIEDTGAVYLFEANKDKIEIKYQLNQNGVGINENGDLFGKSMVSLDFNNDSIGDLVIGAPGEDIGNDKNTGSIYVFKGEEKGLKIEKMIHLETPFIGYPEGFSKNNTNEKFGTSLFSGDFNNDGFDDLFVVSENRYKRIYAFLGSEDGFKFLQELLPYGFRTSNNYPHAPQHRPIMRNFGHRVLVANKQVLVSAPDGAYHFHGDRGSGIIYVYVFENNKLIPKAIFNRDEN